VKTRSTLALALSALTLCVGLLACVLQSFNHARAQELARTQRKIEMLQAANAQADALVSAHVAGVPNQVPVARKQKGGVRP
jgi:predicted histidine transporter YuiF (NhaC family)